MTRIATCKAATTHSGCAGSPNCRASHAAWRYVTRPSTRPRQTASFRAAAAPSSPKSTAICRSGVTATDWPTCIGAGKFRGPDFAKITFRHETVTTPELVDHSGRKLPTVVAQVVETETTAAGAISEDNQLLAAMLGRPNGTLEEWAADCRWFTKGDAKRPNKSLAKRVSDRLSEAQLVAKKGRKLVLTPAGEPPRKGLPRDE